MGKKALVLRLCFSKHFQFALIDRLLEKSFVNRSVNCHRLAGFLLNPKKQVLTFGTRSNSPNKTRL